MAGPMRRMMEYLSFAEPQDEEYEDYLEAEETRPARATAEESEVRRGATRAEPSTAAERFGSEPADRTERIERLEARPVRAERTEQSVRPASSARAEVTPIKPNLGHELRRIVTVHPTTYNEARTIGEAFREGTPVIVNLTDMGEADAKRMVDFAAGLVFGLHGTIERVTSRVFLLSPASVEVESDEDLRDGRVFHRG